MQPTLKAERRKEEKSEKEDGTRIDKQSTLPTYTKPYNTIIAEAKHHCIKNFGFVSDPSKKLWEHIPSALKALPTRFVLQSPANQYCHNLCTETAPPPGYNYLLGLGLNYCIESLHPKPNINVTVKKMEKSIRLKHWLSKNGIENNEDYIPSLYVPTTWKPPEASHEIEEAIQTFTTNLNKMVEIIKLTQGQT